MSDILTNEIYNSYDYVSRYSNFPFYYNTRDKKYVGGLTAYLDDSTLYSLYTVQQGDTFDNLALRFYNNPTLFWIICSFNHIQNPYIKLKVGQKIKIPSISNIKFDVNGRGVTNQ